MQIVQKKLILFLFTLLLFACSRDKVMEISCDTENYPTYGGEIRSIINANCAYVGCHVSGFSSGDYTSFQNLITHVGPNTNFLSEVTSGDMPPLFSTGPTELSDADILTIQCWAQGGYLEN